MPRLQQSKIKSGKRILLVDDQADYAMTTAALISREGHDVVTASSGEEALKILRREYFDLILLDYYMPGGMTGEDTVVQLRKFNTHVQVILQTGYAGEYPPREMLRRLDIQGYHDKADGPDKLLLWIDVGLKVAYMVQLLFKSRQGLRYILDVTPEMHKIQPLEDLLQGILYEITGLIGAVNSFVAIVPEDRASSDAREHDTFLAFVDEGVGPEIRVATGRFAAKPTLESCLEKPALQAIQEALDRKQTIIVDGFSVVPLYVGEKKLGVIYLDQGVIQPQEIELLEVFANQAAVAVQNTRLYEMATIDPLTSVYVRRVFDQWLLQEIRSVFRENLELSVLMIDMDGLKMINDTAGHPAGDQALIALGKVLRRATRTVDVAARCGGDEFAVLLPKTSIENAARVAERILEMLQDESVQSPQGPLSVRVSIGIAGVGKHGFDMQKIPHPVPQAYWAAMAARLVQGADSMLYLAKKSPGPHLHIGDAIEWPDVLSE
jgi:two-component system, cell cycle response regulator